MYINAELIPINKYRIVQAIGNTIVGGDKGGLTNVPYSFIISPVSIADAIPISIGTSINTVQIKYFLFFIIIYP